MTEGPKRDTREALLVAAADLISAHSDDDVSLRAICDAVGVKLPTLYHYFGSRQGLIDSVVDYGFAEYLASAADQVDAHDAIDGIRQTWDLHVRFGLQNPAFYLLMYGRVRPGAGQGSMTRPEEMIHDLARRAARDGRLVVNPELATKQVMAALVGSTLSLIRDPTPGSDLSTGLREATLSAITTPRELLTASTETRHDPAWIASTLSDVLRYRPAEMMSIGEAESALLLKWLDQLAGSDERKAGHDSPRRGHLD